MASRERLRHAVSASLAVATAPRVRLATQLLLVAGLVVVLSRLGSIWHDSHIRAAQIDWTSFAGASLLAAFCVVVTGFIWLVILRQLGIRTRPRWVGIFFQAQLAKYIPGSVWHYAGRAALARSRSIPLRPVLTSMTVELVAVVTAAGLVATLAAGFWAAGATVAVLVLAGIALTQRGLRRAGVRLLVRLRIAGTVVHRPAKATAVAAALYLPVWALLGLSFWLTARSLFGVGTREIAFYTGAFAVAWLVGLAAVFAPGGLGVREAALVGLLHSRLPAADAVLLAAVSRGILTAVDLVAGGVGAVVLRLGGDDGVAPLEEAKASAARTSSSG